MLDVFITVDTEVSTYGPRWSAASIDDDIQRDIYGVTVDGAYGISYQINVLNAHGLKAAFFVEALFADVAGLDRLRDMVGVIQQGGQEVQLHLHPEWLQNMPDPILPGRIGNTMSHFSEEEQCRLIARGLANLRACGVHPVAFRAGDYGADFATLRALATNGILFDTSYNECYLDSTCGLRGPQRILHPRMIEGVCELPVAVFSDYPDHYRHAQICACSSQEMEHALLGAWKRGWKAFVIVSHSFELIRRGRRPGERTFPDPIVIRRFERLCRFLAAHGDKFRTATFADLDPVSVIQCPGGGELHGRPWHTGLRVAQQAVRRARAAVGGRKRALPR